GAVAKSRCYWPFVLTKDWKENSQQWQNCPPKALLKFSKERLAQPFAIGEKKITRCKWRVTLGR
ncbi:hypothetical protein, partial [Flavobacterium agri]|uniref:hypothetical protein n=1 Tax=Flavobacterium agri TaxID=2743471 RepID=UPI001C376787